MCSLVSILGGHTSTLFVFSISGLVTIVVTLFAVVSALKTVSAFVLLLCGKGR